MRQLISLIIFVCCNLAASEIRGYSFYGLCTPAANFVCWWHAPAEKYVAELAREGFNHLRIPFSVEYVWKGDWTKMDEIFWLAQKYNQWVTLDLHRVWSDHQSSFPTAEVTFDQIIQAWDIILTRYSGHPKLVAADIFNENQRQDAVEHTAIMRQIVIELERRHPERFTWVVGGYRFGGTVSGVDLEDLPFSGRIRYTVHKYPFSTGSDLAANLNEALGQHAGVNCDGSVYTNKVGIGEWDWGPKDSPQDFSWARDFIKYLKGRNITDNFYWTVAHSGDTSNLYQDDCETMKRENVELVKTLWTPDPPPRHLRYGGVL